MALNKGWRASTEISSAAAGVVTVPFAFAIMFIFMFAVGIELLPFGFGFGIVFGFAFGFVFGFTLGKFEEEGGPCGGWTNAAWGWPLSSHAGESRMARTVRRTSGGAFSFSASNFARVSCNTWVSVSGSGSVL